MKANFETEDAKEMARIVKSLDMALLIFEYNQCLLNKQRNDDSMVGHFHEWLQMLGEFGIDLDELLE